MGTVIAEKGLVVLEVPVSLLGPGSAYEVRLLALRKDIQQLCLDASKITNVSSQEEAESANAAGRVLQSSSKELEYFFTPIKRQIDAFKAPVLAHERELSVAVDMEKRRLGGLLTTYNQEQERIRQEEERKAREEAERQAREEQLARAVELEASGDTEAADAVLDEPIFAPAVIQTQAPAKMPGQVGALVYSATVMDLKTLLKAVVEGRAPLQCIVADESYLNSKAKLEKDGFNVPGVRLNKVPKTHFRA